MIGHINGANPTTVSKTQEANGSDSPLGNLIADGQKADPSVVQNGKAPVIALMNPGGIRADLVENAAGDVTYGAAFTVQPFNNFVVSMDLTGAQIKALLNEQWNGANESTARSTRSSRCPGIQYTWDKTLAAQPNANALVGNVMVDADGNPDTPMVPLADGTTYRVVANSFLSDGGDNFATFKAGTNKLIGGLDIDSLRLYLQSHDPYTVTPTDRISSRPEAAPRTERSSARRTTHNRTRLTTGTTGQRRSSPAFPGPTAQPPLGPLACDRPAKDPPPTPSGAIPMTAAPTRRVVASERSAALPRRTATVGALLAAALAGPPVGRTPRTGPTSTATCPASTRARTSCSPRPTGTWSAGSPTASRPSSPRTSAARAAPSAGSSASSTRRRSRTSRPTRSRTGGRACTAAPPTSGSARSTVSRAAGRSWTTMPAGC